MVRQLKVQVKSKGELFYVRRLNKAGGSRYLSIGKILPLEWDAVKIYMSWTASGAILLRLEQIK